MNFERHPITFKEKKINFVLDLINNNPNYLITIYGVGAIHQEQARLEVENYSVIGRIIIEIESKKMLCQ